MMMLAFDDVFVQIRPSVLFVKKDDIAQYLYDPISSQIEAEIYETPKLENAFAMTSCDIMVFAFLDGGLAFVQNEWGDDDSREAAFGHWVREREAAGEEWEEDDFVHQPTIDYEGPPLLSGCYVIGTHVIDRVLSTLKSRTLVESTGDDWPGASRPVSSHISKRTISAESIAKKLHSCSWEELAEGCP